MARLTIQAPKPKKVKKTKQQLEEERKQAEEAARLAEEGNLHKTCTLLPDAAPASFRFCCNLAVNLNLPQAIKLCSTSIDCYNAYVPNANVRCRLVVWMQSGYVWKQKSKQERLQRRRSGRSLYSFRRSVRMPALPVKGSTPVVGAAALLAKILMLSVFQTCIHNLIALYNIQKLPHRPVALAYDA